MAKSTHSNQIKELSDREWLLIRGHNIIGSLKPINQQSFLYNTDTKKFNWETYEYIPGLVKIINEILDNSLDVAIKSKFEFSNEISVELTDKKVVIKDNGFGIPVEQTADGSWIPEVAWGRARAGSNFDDDEDRVSAGMNGIGSFATTVFSKRFRGVTDDGKNKLIVMFRDNAAETSTELLASDGHGTTVTFEPDLERFGVKEIDELHQSLIYQRILNLSMMYPEIRFKFNKRLVKLDAKKFVAMFSDTFEILEEDNYMVAVFPNEAADFSYHTYVNSLWLEKGGNHVSFLTGKIVDDLRNRLVRKYKSIKPGDIKNKISTIIFFKNFPNANFDSQTKEFLTNTQKEITSFLNFNDASNKKDWDRFTTKIYKNKALIDPITDLYNAKMLIEERKKLKAANKQDVPEKYWPATDQNKYMFFAEGDSAIGAITAELGRSLNGFFPLKGVPLNVVKDRSKVAKNAEIKQMASILGIDLSTNNNPDLEYENIIIAPDRDVDGSHIAGIALGFFATYTPQYLEQGRVFLFVTPLITILNKKNQVKFVFTMDEYEAFRAKHDPDGSKFIYDYKKGLGTMEEFEWKALFEQFKLEDLLQPLHLKGSENPKEEIDYLKRWLADDTDFRKSKILNKIKDFDINKV